MTLVRLADRADSAVPETVQPQHRERLAVVYMRRSTLQQAHDHQESTQLQYGLTHTARQLRWPAERVLVIDDDLGKSGSTNAGWLGFQRLVTEVTLNHVGLILGLEMSRLARSNTNWHHLLEVCALFRTLIADQDGLYDPGQYNDRLLLGLKGTMSEAELHILKQRLHAGKLNKANAPLKSLRLARGLRRFGGEVSRGVRCARCRSQPSGWRVRRWRSAGWPCRRTRAATRSTRTCSRSCSRC
jgi:DNA invertase Pin-like site-specific DNA recombinase